MEGKILAAKYARENSIPFFGICLGMQIAVIEYARSVLGLEDANSTEFNPDTKNPCVIFMPEVDFYFTSPLWKSFLLQLFGYHNQRFTLWDGSTFAGFKNSHGGHHASWIKEDIFSGS